MDKAGICFLHAPLFHPAMKTVAPIRRELGVKTFFNMLGPMVNPANPKNQLIGVFNLELARVYAYLYQKSDVKYTIVNALDGYDEISLTGDFKTFSAEGEKINSIESLGFEKETTAQIAGGSDRQIIRHRQRGGAFHHRSDDRWRHRAGLGDCCL